MPRTPALIVGGGPAGAALAQALARAGRPHLLVERTREVGNALCGGFLSWRTLAMLERLGVAGIDLNPAPITRVGLFAGSRRAEAALPGLARAVSRRRLDTALIDAATRAGASVERGVAVRAIDQDPAGGWAATMADGGAIAADTLFLASGKHDVRGGARPASARGSDPTLGLRLRLTAGPSLDRLLGDAIELHLLDRGYAGVVRQEDGSGNLCLAVRRSRLHEAGDPERLLASMAAELPALGDRLAFRDRGPIDAVANVPYGWRAHSSSPGLFRLGDQAGVIPSLAGEGMAIALASAAAALTASSRGAGAVRYQRAFAARLRRPVGVAATVWHLAERPGAAAFATVAAGWMPGVLRRMAAATRID